MSSANRHWTASTRLLRLLLCRPVADDARTPTAIQFDVELERDARQSSDDSESRKAEAGDGWLPVELVDAILSFVVDASDVDISANENDPRATLAAASLVCSVWLGPARKHLFRHVRVFLWNAHAFGSLFPLLAGHDAQDSEPPPTFPAQIHSIELFGELSSDPWLPSVLPKILPSFTALDTLILSRELPKADSLPRSLAHCVKHLELRGSYTHSTPRGSIHLDQLVASFPHLESLVVNHFEFSFAGTPLVLPPLKLRKIHLDNSSILDWIIGGGGGSLVSDLRLSAREAHVFGDLGYLGRLPKLRSLDLSFGVRESLIDVFLSTPLPSLPPLHTLAITADYSRTIALLLRILAHLPTHHLTALTLIFDARYPQANTGPLPFDQLDTALASLPSLDRRKLIIKQIRRGAEGWLGLTEPSITEVMDMRNWLPKTYAGIIMDSTPCGSERLARARRKYLFRRISVSLGNADRFGRLFTAIYPSASDENTKNKRKSLPPTTQKAVPPTFPAYVRAMELDEKLTSDLWVSTVLPNLLPTFAALDTLALSGAFPEARLSARCIRRVLLGVGTLRRMRLDELLAHFVGVESFKLTQELSLQATILPQSFSEENDRPSLERLRRIDVDDAKILQWIACGGAPNVTEIRVEVSTADSLAALDCLDAFLTLESLDLILSDADVAESFVSRHLPTLPPLQTLRIQAPYPLAGPALLHILSSIPTFSLSTLIIAFAVGYLESGIALPITSLPWTTLDAALSELPSLIPSRLTVLKVLVSPRGWRSRIDGHAEVLDARRRLPKVFKGMSLGVDEVDADEDEQEQMQMNTFQPIPVPDLVIRPAGSPRSSGCDFDTFLD
ncbi:hypothetical protein HMN09_01178000 [Mycena chlorophos]|uniref:F-box domain-containing protein n=1 Tax=Mycena chlorophos TaxID=658473 RepID=A0A8H6VVV9_MYCCL|nr:hypothetical protein HMN09_01178000 [Mycena chlorophos]